MKKNEIIKWIILCVLILCLILLIFGINKRNSDATIYCTSLNASNSNNPKCNNIDSQIPNGSFENFSIDEYSNFTLDGWINSNPEQNIYLIDTADGEYNCYDGEYCLDLNVPYYNRISTNIDINKTGKKKISFDYYPVDTYGSLTVGIIEKDAEGKEVNTLEDEVDVSNLYTWQKYEQEFNVDSGVTDIELYFSTTNENEIYGENVLIDNIQMGNDSLYDITSDISMDSDGFIVDSNVMLVSGMASQTEYKVSLNQDATISDVMINGVLIDDEKISVSQKSENSKSQEEKLNTEFSIPLETDTSNTDIRFSIKLNNYYPEKNNLILSSKVNYNNYYSEYNLSKELSFNSDMEMTQTVKDESDNNLVSNGEKLTYTIELDNSNSEYPEYNSNIIINSDNNENIQKMGTEGVKVYNMEGDIIDQSLYSYDSLSRTLKINTIPQGEKYYVVYSLYANDGHLKEGDEVENSVSYNSSNRNSYSRVSTNINIDEDKMIFLDTSSILTKIDEDTYDLSTSFINKSQTLSCHELVIEFFRNSSSELLEFDKNLLSIKSSDRALEANTDYIIGKSSITIHELKPGEKITINYQLKIPSLNTDGTSGISLVYKSDEYYNSKNYEWIWEEILVNNSK